MQKLPYPRNLPNSGLIFYIITGVTLYLSRNVQKDWQFVQNRWVKHPTFSIFCQKYHNLALFSGGMENLGNLTVKRFTIYMSVYGGPS